MSVNIDSLDIQISTSAGSAEQNIDALAKALGRLKENSKITTVVNNLGKLNATLNGLTAGTFTSDGTSVVVSYPLKADNAQLEITRI